MPNKLLPAKCQKLLPPRVATSVSFPSHAIPLPLLPIFTPHTRGKSQFSFQAQQEGRPAFSMPLTLPPHFEIPHYLAHLEGWGEVADLSPPLGLVNLSDLHDPSWIILTIYWPYHNLLAYQSLLRPTSSSLPGSCAALILHYQVPLLFPPFIGCSAPFSLLSLPSDLHFYLSPIGCSFCPSSSSTPALHSLASFTLLTCSSASLLAPSNSHPYLSSQLPMYHSLLTLIGLLTRPSPFLYPPWPHRPPVTHQTTFDWRRRWAHPEGRSLAAHSRPEAHSRRHRRRRAVRSQAGSRPGARRSPGAHTRQGPARSPPRRRRPRAPAASPGRREARAGMGRPSLSP